jgi:hypothetical protein
MDADRKLLRVQEAIAYVARAHDQPEKAVIAQLDQVQKILDQERAGMPAGRAAHQKRMAEEAERKQRIKDAAALGAAPIGTA